MYKIFNEVPHDFQAKKRMASLASESLFISSAETVVRMTARFERYNGGVTVALGWDWIVSAVKQRNVCSSYYRWKDVVRELWTRVWCEKLFGWLKSGRNWLRWKMENKQASKKASKMMLLQYHNSHISYHGRLLTPIPTTKPADKVYQTVLLVNR